MKHYLEQPAAVLEELGSSEQGLSPQEAELRLGRDGRNKLAEPKRASLIRRFLSQLADPMIIILIVAAAISAITSVYEGHVSGEGGFPTDTVIILAVVVINAVLGVLQESKAEQAIDALQKMSAATSHVLRGGELMTVPSEELAVGDVVLLEAGDAVPADCRILECASLKAEESALTGESVPVDKQTEALGASDGDVPLGDRRNMLYMGSSVVYGRGRAVVTAVGMNTEMGRIADAITQAQDGQTPLQKKLSQLSKLLTMIVLGICVFIFAYSLISGRDELTGGDSAQIFGRVIDMFMVAVSLAVAAIPEGLAAVVTVVLSIGVTNMSKRNAIIRKLTAVETLGCAQVICTDKTGTLTQNRMTVVRHYGSDERLLATALALCSDARESGDGIVGEPTEAALVAYAASLELHKSELERLQPRVDEAPFDSMRKMMTTVHSLPTGGEELPGAAAGNATVGRTDGGYIAVQYTKGAPDVLLGRCTAALVDGVLVPMTAELRERIEAENRAMAEQALRVLAAAYRPLAELPDSSAPEALEQELVFLGLVGMIDPVRPEVGAAIEQCREAGIIPVMITGDHRDTAVAIARELGILSDPSQALTGAQLSEMSDEELRERVCDIRVYARVQPEHKTRIVNAWRACGYVTAMTGDGVNDAPSIKSADIGIGMGITGTDVTKNVADMVLADDNFATIVGAVGEGRRIYDNIRRAIQFLLGSNLAEVLTIFLATVLGFTVFRAPHLLFINLVTDCFPALALGLEQAEPGIMRRRPRDVRDGIFSGGLGFDVLYQGGVVTALTLAAFFIGERLETGYWAFRNIAECEQGMTMAFLTMSMCEIFHSFNMRSQRGSTVMMSLRGSHNMPLFGAMLASLVLTTVLIEVPVLAAAFGFTPIGIAEYAISIGLALSIIPIVEIVKAIQRKI